jgi:hypothetical protein
MPGHEARKDLKLSPASGEDLSWVVGLPFVASDPETVAGKRRGSRRPLPAVQWRSTFRRNGGLTGLCFRIG